MEQWVCSGSNVSEESSNFILLDLKRGNWEDIASKHLGRSQNRRFELEMLQE